MYSERGLGDFDWGALANAVGSVATAGASIYNSVSAQKLSLPVGVSPLAYNFGVPSGLVNVPGNTPGYQTPYYLPAPPSPSLLSDPTTLTLIALGGVAVLFLAFTR